MLSQSHLCIDNYKAENTSTVHLTSCLFCLDSAAFLLLNEQQFYLFCQIQTSQTGSQLYCDTSPYGECSLYKVAICILPAHCRPGTFSADGLERCSTCPIGSFAPFNGSTDCQKCPAGSLTTRRGSASSADCQSEFTQLIVALILR